MKKFLLFSSHDNDFQQSTVSEDAVENIQEIDLFCQSINQRYFTTRIY